LVTASIGVCATPGDQPHGSSKIAARMVFTGISFLPSKTKPSYARLAWSRDCETCLLYASCRPAALGRSQFVTNALCRFEAQDGGDNLVGGSPVSDRRHAFRGKYGRICVLAWANPHISRTIIPFWGYADLKPIPISYGRENRPCQYPTSAGVVGSGLMGQC
jgi:hypothetical protein